MASLEDLKQVLRETLESRGVLGQLHARIRAEIFNALEDQPKDRPQLSTDNLIINELIRDYLQFNGYHNTLSVFQPETNQPNPPPFDNDFLASHLHLGSHTTINTPNLPLLYRMVHRLHKGQIVENTTLPKQQASYSASSGKSSRKSSTENVQTSLDPNTGAPKSLSFARV
uniref:Uncharacterized protein n=1 Tax=Spongospora subterranea TaxID=70186 RepID=A0A0H5RAZ4_9EUKA|eukprot:CRZ10782.1 hypothetical protein [Spongospora subterranea]